ncbi:signal transduction histidine kinase [Planomonospora sphaerica]|uniref:histidine kinase n=1 Tax=Planomonospora sphaerica TaxID=161355 RepID=A0A161LR37_9ACTN|nr:ATP-binding protein [Planomonospora sphaerica]GAT70016.1 signal transduction histidine kinase [Planomonospora sphaerica]
MEVNGGDRVGDRERLRTLYATGLLDAPAPPALDRVTRLVVRLLEVPAAAVTLITEDRQVVISAAGAVDSGAVRSVPLSQSLCRYVVADDAPLVIGDTRGEERACELLEGTGGQPAAYAGVPLNAPGGQVIGALCAIDTRTRAWSREQVRTLEDLAALIEPEIASRLALAESRRRFDRVISRISDNVWSVEVASDGSLLSIYQSQEAAPLLGHPAPEGADVPELIARRIHPDDQAAYAAFLDVLRTGERADIEFRILGLDDVMRWIWARGFPRREGTRLFVDGIATDVTDHHELTEHRERLLLQQKQQVERLHQIDEMKNQFLRTINHELRTPLASIRSSMQLMCEGEVDARDQQRFLEVIDRNSVRLEHLLNELLLVTSLHAGSAAFNPARVDLAALAREAVRTVTAQCRAARRHADPPAVAVHAPAAVTVWADAGHLRHALNQLLDNAVTFTPSGGRVTVTVTAEPTPVIEVADTGVGIGPHDLEHVFDDFYRGADAEQRAGGTGMGLPLVKKIASMHGGEVAIDSRLGHGTRVRLVLPALAAHGSGPPGRRDEAPPPG